MPAALAGSNSLTVRRDSPTTATGVWFDAARSSTSSSTRTASATSQTFYPPAGSSTAELQIRKQQLRARVPDTKTFTVLP